MLMVKFQRNFPFCIIFNSLTFIIHQSSGKSSTLESLVGESFLPRGKGIVTRCPLILQLIHCPLDDLRRNKEDGRIESKSWGEFTHSEKIFASTDDIREEINRRTNELAGDNKGIQDTPINLKIYSPNVVNLTLVDLPGLTKVSRIFYGILRFLIL